MCSGFYPAQIFIQETLTTFRHRQFAVIAFHSRFIVCRGKCFLFFFFLSPYFSPYINITLVITKIIKQIGRALVYDELPSPWCIAAGCSSATEIFIDSIRDAGGNVARSVFVPFYRETTETRSCARYKIRYKRISGRFLS